MFRNPSEGLLCLGVLSFGSDFTPIEGAAYYLVSVDGAWLVIAEPIDSGLDAMHESAGLSALAKASVWYRTPYSGCLCARFVLGGENGNTWTFLAAAQEKINLFENGEGHAWFDVSQGEAARIEPPIDATGLALGQILNDHAVWPDVDGVLFAMPQTHSKWREPQYRLSKLRAALGSGAIDSATYRARIDACSTLRELHPFGMPDMDFCRTLASIDAADGIAIEKPLSGAQLAMRHHRMQSALQEVLGHV